MKQHRSPRPVALAVATLLAGPSVAQIVADPAAPRGQQPTVLRTANGLPQVDIRGPSQAGVSRNTFRQFDVAPQGAILNNSRGSTPTQLGGWVQGNPWLAAGPARIILGEVRSSDPSQLRGFVEVAGTRAEVVIANPAGIVANGGGFINASRATLTTGVPVWGAGGSLAGFEVRQGLVQVEGAGLNASGTDYTAILSRAMRAEGGVWAQELRVVTGVNDVSADGAQVTPRADATTPSQGSARSGTGNPVVTSGGPPSARAIDVAQLGGMYAGRIFLVATEAGVGVVNAGTVAAGSGTLKLDAAGYLHNTGQISAQGDVRLAAARVDNAGDLVASLAADGRVAGTGQLAIDAAGPVVAQGRQLAAGAVTVSGATLDLAGSHTQGASVRLQARSGDLLLGGGQVLAAGTVEAVATGVLKNEGGRIEGQVLALGASRVRNAGTLVSAGDTQIAGPLSNLGRAQAGDQMSVEGDVDNAGELATGSSLAVMGAVNNSAGIRVGADLAVRGGLMNGGAVQAGRDMAISGGTTNRGRLLAAQDVAISGGLTNNGSLWVGRDAWVTGGLSNGGVIQAGRDAALIGGLANTGLVQAGEGLVIDSRGSHLTNRGGDGLQAGTLLIVRADDVHNARGRIRSGGLLQVDASRVDNSRGQVVAAGGGDVRLRAEALLNLGGTVSSAAGVDIITTGAIDNHDAGGQRAAIEAAGHLRAVAGTVFANTASVVGATLDVSAGQAITNRGPSALIGATDPAGRLSLAAPLIENSDDVTTTDTAASTTILGMGEVVLAGGRDAQGGWVPADRIVNRSALIEAGRSLTLVAREVTNTRRQVQVSAGFDRPVTPEELAATGISLSGQVGETNVRNPAQIGGVYIEPPHEGRMNSDYRYTTYEGQAAANAVTAISPRARLIAGGDIDLTGVQFMSNRWSDVSAGGGLLLGAARVDQDSWRGATMPLIRVEYTGDYHYTTYKGNAWSQPFAASDVRYYAQRLGLESTMTARTAVAGQRGSLVNGGGSVPGGAGPGPGAGPLPAPLPLPKPEALQIAATAAPLPAITVPPSALYRRAPDPAASYLVEADPRFTQYRQWLSSDFLLDALGIQPARIEKRLGDGFLEQRQVREQLAHLTGRRILNGYADEEAQYRAFLASGATQARTLQLMPGVALSAEQAAQLTSDIVWLVRQEVQLPDGSRTVALVPRVYLSPASLRLQPDGALVAAQTIDLREMASLSNAGTLAAGGEMRLDALGDLDSRMGRLLAGDLLSLSAGNDIDLTGALVQAGRWQAQAGRDIVITAPADLLAGATARIEVTGDAAVATGRDFTLRGAQVDIGGRLAADIGLNLDIGSVAIADNRSAEVAGGRTSSQSLRYQGSELRVTGDSAIRVGGDLRVSGSDVQLGATAGSNARLDVTGSITLEATRDSLQVDSRQQRGRTSGEHHWQDETVNGARLSAGGSLDLRAGQDFTVAGSAVEAQGQLRVDAGGSVIVTSVAESHSHDGQSSSSRTRGLERRAVSSSEHRASSVERSASIGGSEVTITAQSDVKIRGSEVLADRDLAVSAGRDLSIEASAERERSSSTRQVRRAGVFASGGSITLGTRTQAGSEDTDSTRAHAATVGSVGGSVTLQAGRQYRQTGSDVMAPQGDVAITARQVDITEARETEAVQSEQHTRQGGLSVGVSSPIVSSIRSADRSLKAAGQTPNERMKALAHASAGLQVYGAIADATDAGFKPDAKKIMESLSLNVSLGNSRADSVQAQTIDTARQSSVKAGGQLSITATGAGQDSTIRLQGVDLTSGGDTALRADGDIAFLAARNATTERSQSASSSASIGVSVSLAGGVTGNAAASRLRGSGDGDDIRWDNTRVTSGGRLSVNSGGNVDARGAVLQADRIVARVAGDLQVESLQDTARFSSRSNNAGFSVSVPLSPPDAGVPGAPGAAGAGSGAGSAGWRVGAGRSRASGSYDGVNEQSGVFAGAGGFDIAVGGNTALVGGVLASAADPSANRLVTGSMTQRDITNASSASASSQGISLSSDMVTQGRYGATKGVVGNLMDNSAAKGSSRGITRSAVSEGTVVITDGARQQALTGQTSGQLVAALNRDTADAQQAAGRIDGKALLRQVQAEQTIRNEAVAAFTRFSDPAWRVMFKEKPGFYRVTCPAGADCTRQPELAKTEKITGTPEQVREEIAKAPPGTVLAVNGIQNPLERAGQLALQNARPDDNQQKPSSIVLMHYMPTGNVISELLVAGYEKGLAPMLGQTNPSLAYADALQARGVQDTSSDGHSRGTIVQVNALSILKDRGYVNQSLSVRGVGGAVAADRYLNAAIAVTTTDASRPAEFSYFRNDPVAVIAGGNPGVVSLTELWRVITTSNSAHSCYGTGAEGCRQVQYLSPNAPPGARQDNSSLQVTRSPALPDRKASGREGGQ